MLVERSRWIVAVGVMGYVLAVASCAHAPDLSLPGGSHSTFSLDRAPAADSTTLAVWRMDEATGPSLVDGGRLGLGGLVGPDCRPDFGRFLNGKKFTSSINSFCMVPYSESLELGPQWTIEAWVKPLNRAPAELSILASRWNDSANEQSWVLGLAGENRSVISNAAPPGYFNDALQGATPNLLVFVMLPEVAGVPRAYKSYRPLELNRWTHIAVTYEGNDLRMYVDGRLDAQFADVSRPRQCMAPLVLGNFVDPRWLVDSQGSKKVDPQLGQIPFYAFEGSLDELRLSTEARVPR
jgi:hypothetical protein